MVQEIIDRGIWKDGKTITPGMIVPKLNIAYIDRLVSRNEEITEFFANNGLISGGLEVVVEKKIR